VNGFMVINFGRRVHIPF